MNLNIKTVKDTYEFDKSTGNYLKVLSRVTEKVEKPYELISAVTIVKRFVAGEYVEIISNECKYIRTIKEKKSTVSKLSDSTPVPDTNNSNKVNNKGKQTIPTAK